jgi:hypothetical protein
MALTQASQFPEHLKPFLAVGVARPETWGPPTWDALIHMLNGVGSPTQDSFETGLVVFVLSSEEVARLHQRLRVFGELLPCPRCSSHFIHALEQIDLEHPEMQTRAGWLSWATMQKDAVNRLSGKPTHTPTQRAAFVKDIINLTGTELWAKRSAPAKKKHDNQPCRQGVPFSSILPILVLLFLLLSSVAAYVITSRRAVPGLRPSRRQPTPR